MRRDKTVATWLAIVAGALGLHRFYLHGWRDKAGWLFPLPTLLGVLGVLRMDALGQDDRLAWALIPLLGITLSAAMLGAIVVALTPDERWAARFGQPARATRWGPVLGAIVALLVGATVLMSTVAFGIQKLFEWQLEAAAAAAAAAAQAPASALVLSPARRSTT